ncbi:MAG: hypothetical protein JNL69_01760 [Bacteroidia bacterium]|nr:hypothetical protein [Bacteroidia bacterium]
MITKNSIKFVCVIGVTSLLFACGSSEETDDTVSLTDTSVEVKEKDTKAQNVFYSIPSPIETTSLLKAAGAKYNKMYLNPIENVSKYSSVKSKAINLGVYGSDLSFTSIFDQTQESMLYLRCANKLSAGLGINGAFDDKTTARLEANLENRDSLLTIISDSYWNADSYLKDNGQPGVSALIIAGGWMEGLYIATQIANTTNNTEIIKRIGEQKLSFDNLIALLDSHKTESESVAEVLAMLMPLKEAFDSVEAKSGETTVSTDKENGVTTIGNNSSYTMTPEQLKLISQKTAEIRNKMIQ